MEQGTTDVLRARRIEVVDDAGRVRLVIGTSGADDYNSVTLSLIDRRGTERLSAHVSDNGGKVEVWEDGNVVASL